MRKMARRIYCVFEKKRRAVHGRCHRLRQGIPFFPAGPRQGGGDGTSSSSGGTTTGGPCGTSSSETVTAEPCNETTTGGELGPPLPLAGLLPPVGPRQRGPVGLGLPLPPVGPQQFWATTARPPLQQCTCALRWGPPLHRT
jgi:hypothetical protein